MPRAKLNPKGHIVFILEGADGSYYTGMCEDLSLVLKQVADGKIRHFRKPSRFPVKVVFQETQLPFKEAYIKFKYLRQANRVYRKKIIDTKCWPAGKLLQPLILKKMEKYLAEDTASIVE